MIVYSPINGEVLTSTYKFYPRTAFIMTQLGEPIPESVLIIRNKLNENLLKNGFSDFDASTLITGRDFLDKIWKMILGVPLGIAILTKDIKSKTLANVFYELGIMDSLGKETLIIKDKDYEIPSDFKRTEYINYRKNFSNLFDKFCENITEREEHYYKMADLMKADPVLAIDYLKRAYLINPKIDYMNEAKHIFEKNKSNIDNQSKFHIKCFLSL